MTIDKARLSTLMSRVEQTVIAMATTYRLARDPSGPSLLATEQAVLQLLRQAAHALSEACVLVADDPATYAKLERLREKTVERLIESAHTCMAIEDALLMSEAELATKH